LYVNMPNLPEIIQLRQSRYTSTQETRKLDKCGRVLYMMGFFSGSE
jgi:hypothetical protein